MSYPVLKGEKVEFSTRPKSFKKNLRKNGKVPAILYHGGEKPIELAVDHKDLAMFLVKWGTSHLFELQLKSEDGKEENHLAIVKELQKEVLKYKYIHVDFYEVKEGQRVRLSVPLKLTGECKGVLLGGKLMHYLDEVEIECDATKIPEAIVHDITNVGVDETVHVGDLTPPDGVKILTLPETLICHVEVLKETKEEVKGEAEEEQKEASGEKEKSE